MRTVTAIYCLLAALGLAGGPLARADGTDWRIVAPAKTEKVLPQLPALAAVERRDDSGKTWNIEGSISGTQPVAINDFRSCFAGQGWEFDKVIAIGDGGRSGSLYLWRRGPEKIFLMLHEVETARTAFALTLEEKPEPQIQK